ncbi:TIGR03089 family protein [Knoellia sp. p5-6-4]|uniref:TIGR03089 family protein n=1 Tax=unclassified Knoellia TaxID=2618719 RepID=UPI0023DAC8B2|nr:TIGR03089 family protein [Knoellia sp. p5-6-4]MDF2146457.1 TIGR03089 family protein [Knoellia sp. p5-6-4]
MRAPRTPAEVLAEMLRSDPAKPRVTWYDDTPGPTAGERIELSAKVLANWVSKAANALQDEFDVAPGSTVRLALPPHWRALYWALAVWSVGGCVSLEDGDADLTVTDDPEVAGDATAAVLVTLPALARSAPGGAPAGVVDEARELPSFGDQFVAWEEPSADDAALRTSAGTTAYGAIVPGRDWPVGTRLHTRSTDLEPVLRDALAVWAVDGSLVLSRGPAAAERDQARLEAEGVTREG